MLFLVQVIYTSSCEVMFISEYSRCLRKKYVVYLRAEHDNRVNYVKLINDVSLLRGDMTKKYANIRVNNRIRRDDEIVQSKIIICKNEILGSVHVFVSNAHLEFS